VKGFNGDEIRKGIKEREKEGKYEIYYSSLNLIDFSVIYAMFCWKCHS